MSKGLMSTLGLFLLMYFATLIANPGFMGTDEYWTGITRYVPAQTQTTRNILSANDVKSSSQILPLLATSHLALKIGINSAYAQYRFVHFFWGVIGILILFFSLNRYVPRVQRATTFLVFTLYFAAPFVLTRSMYESLAAPFILLSALSLGEYLKSFRRFELMLSVVAVSLAFGFRPQTGIAALGLLALVLTTKNRKDFFFATLVGSSFFVSFGFLDLWIRGSFHQSLKDILFYNVKYGSSYADQPWYFYLPLSALLLMLPFLISKSWWLIAKSSFKKQKILWLYAFLILGLHSFFPQKWERFVIPVIPLFLVILAEWLRLLWVAEQKSRLYLILGFNLFLLIPTSFWPAQGNLINFSLYLRDHTEIKTLYRLHNSPEWITEVFTERKNWQWVEINTLPLNLMCHERVVMNQKDFETQELKNYQLDQVFQANPIEKLAYKLNPSKNLRRTSLFLIKPNNC